MALGYPNTYAVGMASLGFQTVYRLFNENESTACERVFTDSTERSGPVSLESGRPLKSFDILAFSLSFESDYLNVLSLLDAGGVPLLSSERTGAHPLVIAGGVASFINPEPLAPFVDLFLLGEAEAVLPGFLGMFDPKRDRAEMLADMARSLPGAYVPSLYIPEWDKNGHLVSFSPISGAPEKVRRAYAKDAADFPTESSFVSPDAAFDSFLVEVARGCPHGCRFCAAGYVYRPIRFRPLETLKACVDRGLSLTSKIGLLGAAVTDLPCLSELCRYAVERGARLAFSSLRADAMTPEIARAIASAGAKTATIAPDAGSERMRRVIGKGISEDDVLNAAEMLVAAGVPNLKLYFMAGLPHETEADVDAIAALTRRVKGAFLGQSRKKGRMGQIVVNVSSFVPKPVTPFQWAAMDPVETLALKMKRIREGLKGLANVTARTDVPRHAFIQALLSRGDRRTGEILAAALKNRGNWPMTFKESGLDPAFYVNRERPATELFPWDFIEQDVSKKTLRRLWEKSATDALAPDSPTFQKT